MAGLLKLMGRQEATKPGFPWSPGPLLLSLLITNEKPRSLALHILSSDVPGAIRLKCRAIPRSSEARWPQTDLGPPQPVGRFSPGQGQREHRTGSGDSTRRRAPGSSDCNIFPTVGGWLGPRRSGLGCMRTRSANELPRLHLLKCTTFENSLFVDLLQNGLARIASPALKILVFGPLGLWCHAGE
jgi:hypothetical protein